MIPMIFAKWFVSFATLHVLACSIVAIALYCEFLQAPATENRRVSILIKMYLEASCLKLRKQSQAPPALATASSYAEALKAGE